MRVHCSGGRSQTIPIGHTTTRVGSAVASDRARARAGRAAAARLPHLPRPLLHAHAERALCAQRFGAVAGRLLHPSPLEQVVPRLHRNPHAPAPSRRPVRPRCRQHKAEAGGVEVRVRPALGLARLPQPLQPRTRKARPDRPVRAPPTARTRTRTRTHRTARAVASAVASAIASRTRRGRECRCFSGGGGGNDGGDGGGTGPSSERTVCCDSRRANCRWLWGCLGASGM